MSVSVSKDFSKGFAAAAAAESSGSGSGSGSGSAKDSSSAKQHRRTGSWPFGRKTPQK